MRISGMMTAVSAFVFTAVSSVAQPAVPYIGQVSVDRVEVRSGAGRAYYPVGELRSGDRVVVVDEFFNWYKIEAPQGVRSFVLKKDIDRQGNGEVGVANTDRVDVNVADPTKGPEKSFRTHKSLSKGDRVQITGENDRWYEITPPQDAYVFLPPNTVSPVQDAAISPTPGSSPGTAASAAVPAPGTTPAPGTDGGMVPAEQAPPTPTPGVTSDSNVADDVAWDGNDAGMQPAEVNPPTAVETPTVVQTPPQPQPQPTPSESALAEADDAMESAVSTVPAEGNNPTQLTNVPVVDPTTTPAPTAHADAERSEASGAPVSTPAISEPLRAVERQMLPKFELPVDEQPLSEMRSAYEGVTQSADLPPQDRRLIEQRLAVIARNADVAETLTRIAKLRQSLPAYDPADIELPPDPQKGYAAVGTLAASTVFTGSRTPQMFRVVDPNTRGTIAYVRPVSGVDLTPHLGAIVGVKGQRQFDPTLNATLITVVSIDPLAPAGQ